MLVAGRSSIWSLYREPALDEALRRWNDIDPVLMRGVVGDDVFHTDGLRFDAHRHGSDLAFGDLHAAIRLAFEGFRTLNASFYPPDCLEIRFAEPYRQKRLPCRMTFSVLLCYTERRHLNTGEV